MSKAQIPARSKPSPAKARGAASKLAKAGNVAVRQGTQVGPLGTAHALASSKDDTVRAKTLRLQPSYEKGLVILKRILHMPINKMVNEAVGEYIERRTAEVESDLTTALEQLHAYRRADPNFLAARQAFIDGEALHGKDDPMEGRVVRKKGRAGDSVKSGRYPPSAKVSAAGPALSKVREMLRG